MAEYITKQDLINAHIDATTLEQAVNGEAETKVTSRLGRQYWTLATIDALIATGLLKIEDLQDAIDVAAAAGAGANGWTASLVVDASGKTQQEINNSILDPILKVPSAPMVRTYDKWNQKDWNDSVVDVRKFIKKDMSNVTTGLQAAIEAAYGQTLHIPIPLQVLDTIYVERGLSILGVNRSVTNYNTDPNVLDFSLLGAGKSAFEIATTSPVIGFQLERLFLKGAKNGGQALKIGASLANNLADFNIKDLIIYNFSKGIEQQYCWDGRYENMRIQACTNGIAHNSQSNVIHYDKCAIVTIDDLALTFVNSEGVQFDCCDISNLTKTNGAPITLFQSAVSFNTGYFENISNANLALVGTASEVTGSRLTFNTPFKLAKNILCGSNISFVDIKQPDSNDVKVVGATLTTEANAKVAARNGGKLNKSIFAWNPKQQLSITGYGGVTATYQDHRNYFLLNSTSAAGGWNITNSLEVGKVYTVMYSIRSTANTVGLGLRHPSAQSTLRSNAVGEVVTIKTVSFVATSSTLNMTWQGDIELYGIQIVEGNLSAMANNPFLQSDFSQPVTVSRSVVPTVGTWRVGDKVENSNPTTHAGWICTVAGTPGTWKQYGAIV